MTVIVNPDELDAMIESRGVASIYLGEQLDLEIRTLRSILLYEVGLRQCLFIVEVKANRSRACAWRETDYLSKAGHASSTYLRRFLRHWSRVCCDHLEPARQDIALPNWHRYSGADNRYAPRRFFERHNWFPPAWSGQRTYQIEQDFRIA